MIYLKLNNGAMQFINWSEWSRKGFKERFVSIIGQKPWNWIVYIDLFFTSSYTTQTNSVLHPLWLANSDVHGKPVLEKEQRADVAHLYVIAGNIVNAGPAG